MKRLQLIKRNTEKIFLLWKWIVNHVASLNIPVIMETDIIHIKITDPLETRWKINIYF
jgi:hypothetical protein